MQKIFVLSGGNNDAKDGISCRLMEVLDSVLVVSSISNTSVIMDVGISSVMELGLMSLQKTLL